MRRWSFRIIAVMAMLSWLLSGVSAQQNQPTGLQQLSIDTETVITMQFSSQLMRTVYISSVKPDYNNHSLYSVNADGTNRIKLNPALSPEEPLITHGMQLTSDGTNVIYIARHSTDSQPQLYSVPITGGTPRLLSPNLPSNAEVSYFRLSPHGAAVLYGVLTTDSQNAQTRSTYQINLDGTNQQLLLENTSEVEYHYFNQNGSILAVKTSLDNGATVNLYRINPATGERVTLHTFGNPSGDYQWVQMNETQIVYTTVVSEAGHPAGLYAIAHNSTTPRLLFAVDSSAALPRGDAMLSATTISFLSNNKLYSVRLSDGQLTSLSTQHTDVQGQVRSFQVTPDGQRVIYTYAATYTGFTGLWSIPSTGGTAIRLDQPEEDYPVEYTFFVSPDSSRVVFLTANMFSVPVDGSAHQVQINNNTYGQVNRYSIAITPDSSKVVYRVWSGNPMQHALVSAPIDGSAQPLALNGLVPFVSGYPDFDLSPNPGFELSNDSSVVVFRAGTVSNSYRNLYATRITVEQARVYIPITTK